MPERVRELSLTIALSDAEAILKDARQLVSLLGPELQAARDDREAQRREFNEFMAEQRETLATIQAKHHIDAMLLGLIQPEKRNRDKNGKVNISVTRGR